MSENGKEVALFVTCLVDLVRPTVGLAAIRLLEQANCSIVIPKKQTCCGQPAFNSGDNRHAISIAKQVIAVFEPYSCVVVPSGSCAGMIKVHYPNLFAENSQWRERAIKLASKIYELTDFLVNVLKVDNIDADYKGDVCYHDSCAGLRELGIKQQPRALLRKVRGVNMKPLAEEEQCCGFGGLFCIKYSDVSNAIVKRKVRNVIASGADTVLAGDLGCLLNISGKLTREQKSIKVWHIAEVLAGMTSGESIGESKPSVSGISK